MALSLYFGSVVPVACLPSAGTPAAPDPHDASIPLRNEDLGEIPCAPRAVLSAICQQCHVSPPRNGAPFPLITRGNILATYSGAIVRDLMIEQLDARRMPLAPVTIPEEDRDTLLAWLRSGAPASATKECVADAGTGAEEAATTTPEDDAEAATPDAEPGPELDAGEDG